MDDAAGPNGPVESTLRNVVPGSGVGEGASVVGVEHFVTSKSRRSISSVVGGSGGV